MPFRLLFEESQGPDTCIDQFDYVEWLEFVFDHPAPKKDQERWYSGEDAEKFYFRDSQLFLRRLTRLMREPELLLGKYSIDQIKQGFWCFITGFELNDLLEDKEFDFETRRQCIESIEALYRRLFRREGFEKIAFLYWDPLTYTFTNSQALPDGLDQANVQDAMFRSLSGILEHEERINFISAARGLSHLRHKDSAQVIYEALNRRTGISEEDRAYVLACSRSEADLLPRPTLITGMS
jgi:hypothetical protein